MGRGFKTDGALMLLHDRCASQGQTMARSFTHRLCSEKWIEYLRLDGLRYPQAAFFLPHAAGEPEEMLGWLAARRATGSWDGLTASIGDRGDALSSLIGPGRGTR